ncbi:MAG: class I SAM-dependent methyltransferase [Clostridia bacterium]|nr:class I SAM-dependent methyltransferase [Clostridia bacterium]
MIDTLESVTAKLCSFARAYHSNYGRQKIFDDYLAFDIMGKQQYDEIGQLIQKGFELSGLDLNSGFSGQKVYPELNRYIAPIPLSRIAFAERELTKFAEEKGRCQYVICGAGMDTFAFRNENPDIEVFELDHPDTSRYKLNRIRELEWNIPENVSYVPIDFSKDDMTEVLKNAGFDSELPTFYAILGVTYYLTLPVFEQTIEKINRLSAGGGKLVFDFPDETTLSKKAADRVKRLTEITAKLGEPMQHGFSVSEIKNALERHHFTIEVHKTPEKIQNQFFDKRTDGQTAFENIHFILAKKEK